MINASRRPGEKTSTALVAHLRMLAATRPADTALIVVTAETETEIRYADLDRRVRALAAQLQARFSPGERVLLLLENNEHYVVAFLGCLYAGLIAVPAFPPQSPRDRHVARLHAIATDAQARCMLVSSDLRDLVGESKDLRKDMEQVAVDMISLDHADRWLSRSSNDDDVVFLQYTSGSTAAPKGVIVEHGNLLANERVIREALRTDPSDVFVSWLPLFHDMGLVGSLFHSLYASIPLVLASPSYFLERPVRWLELISRYRGTISGGPDFAYRLCLERVSDEQVERLDLSSWRVAFCGAEPVHHDTLRAFAERFKRAGFNARALYPCYGLAEATLFVTGGTCDSGMTARTYDSDSLARGHAVEAETGTTLVACGATHSRHRVRIVDPATGEKRPNERVGEIWVSGPSVSRGYWRRDEETAGTFVEQDGERWLRTGDLGFMYRKQLYVTGRQKDLIILRGYNIAPQDIEQAIEVEVEAARKGRVAAFAVPTKSGEAVGVAVEISRLMQKRVPPERLFDELSAIVSKICNEPLHVAVLLNPGGLPKTSSGKVQRAECRKGWQEGTLDAYATLQNGGARSLVPAANSAKQVLTELQRKISSIWSAALGIEAVTSPSADFFALGGNSIKAAQVAARASQEFGVRLAPGAVLTARTLSAFATEIERVPQERQKMPVRIARAAQLPPTAAQRRMWFLWQLQPGSAAYNVGGGLRLRGPLDVAILQRTLDELVRRHEVLRTRFQQRDGVLAQYIDEQRAVCIDTVDLSSHPREAHAETIGALLLAEFHRPFDLQTDPLLRSTLLKVGQFEHVLFVTSHHIAVDGMSMELLVRDLAHIYGAFRNGRAPDRPRSSFQYIDYAAWQEAELKAGSRDRQLAYWTQRLGREYPDVSPHPDRPRPAQSDHRGQRRSIPIEQSLMQGLHRLANAQGVTLFVVLLTAFKIVLARHSSQHDIRVGAPVANRRTLESQAIVGPFVNTIVLRTDLQGNPSVLELLQRVNHTVVDAQAHQDLPFEELVETLAGDRVLSRHPVFQVMHNHQCRERENFQELAPLQAEAFDGQGLIAEFELSLNTEEQDGQIRAVLKYSTAIYDESTVARIAGHWLNALRAMVDAPQARIDEVPLLSPQERVQLLRTFNDTARRYPQCESSVHRLIEQQVARNPDWEAVVFESERCSYRELNERANRLAWRLSENGVGPDVLVGICNERSMELIVGLLAILKSGGAFLPLDPAYPQSRLEFILEDAKPLVLLAGRHVVNKLPATAASVVWLLEEECSATQEGGERDLPTLTHPYNLAYCLYTSGSTGKPKSAANTQGALLNQLLWRQDAYGLEKHDRVLHKTPIGFDVSVWEVFWPLMTGATLVVASPGVHSDPWQLRTIIQDERVTTLHFVPPMLNAFIEAGELARCESLRQVFVGGQALATGTQAEFFQHCPAKLQHLYGPTEAAIDVSSWECHPTAQGSVIPMGRALANTQLYVLDHELEPVPIGVVGELYIAGVQLARGYTDRPGLTASHFLANPFAPGERLYRSGDLARYRPDGALEYVGRIDHQVKVRGFRIELGEIEAQLREHPLVCDAVVLVGRDQLGENELVAHVVWGNADEKRAVVDDSERRKQLHEYLVQRLPDYMLPAHYAWLDALPLLGNGKIDRSALFAHTPTSYRKSQALPRTELECRVAAIWSEVLEVGNIGLHDSFFELGGHSLLAARALSRIRAAFDIELPLRTLFETTRLAEFSERVRRSVENGIKHVLGPIEPVDRSQPLPLSYAQQRMWLLWQLDPLSVAYNLAGTVKLTGALNYAAVEKTLHALVERHEPLRTTFRVVGGSSVQDIAAHMAIPVERLDLRACNDVDRKAATQRHAQLEAHRPFDLQTGPLLRVLLLQLDDCEHAMVVTTHHIVAEGWSIDVFAREFIALYDGFCSGRPAALPPLPVQYADYMHWHRQWLESFEVQRQLSYWQTQLSADAEILSLPADRPRPKVLSSRGDVHRFSIDPVLAQRLRRFSVEQRTTLFMTLLAGYFALLYRYSGQRDLCVGFPVANRIRPEAEGLMGAFLNMQAMRCKLSDAMSFEQLLSQVRESTLAAQSHQDLPFDTLVDAIKPPRGTGFHPLFQAVFNLHRWSFERCRQMGDVIVEVLPNDVRAAQVDLMFDVGDVSDELDCAVTYSVDLFDRQTIERMSRCWIELLSHAIDHRDEKICGIALLGDSDRDLIDALGATGEQAAEFDAVHRRIERQARVSPCSTAVVCGEQRMSYGELNARANRLAHRLASLGVKPEARVGVALERSMELVVGLLGILKAGCAYVPLDPSYPMERLKYMLEDSGVGLVLTQSAVSGRVPPVQGVVALTIDELDFSAEPDIDLDGAIHPDALAYVIYTSGSSGRPKGAQLSHRNVSRLLSGTQQWFQFDARDVWTLFHSYAFDFSVWEIFGSLSYGGRLVIVPFAVSRSPQEFLELLRREQVTVLNQTPSAFKPLLPLAELYATKDLALRAVIFGGEALDPQSLRPWIEHFGDLQPRLINMYGITETTVHVTYRALTRKDLQAPRSPLGVRIPDLGLRVLDAHLNAVPIGVPGELYVAGAGLSRGYLGRRGLTSERFIADPASMHGGRLYRTGDKVCWNREGELEYLGRIDQQVKIRGFRIELGEIESQLLAQPGVGAAVAMAREGAEGAHLVAYVTGVSGAPVDVALLRECLSEVLPDYMVPSAIVVLEQLPLNANGKLDRAALPEPQYTSAAQYEAPQGEIEQALAAIWSQVLCVERVGRHDNFFELGGHSLLALRVLDRIRERGWKAEVRSLFQSPQLAAFARAVAYEPAAPEAIVPPNLIPVNCAAIKPDMLTLVELDLDQIQRVEADVIGGATNIQDIYPLTPLQQGLLFHYLMQSDGDAYVLATTLAFQHRERLESFVASFERVVERHDILRTAVLWEGLPEAVQVVYRHAPVRLQWLDVKGDEASIDATAVLNAHAHPRRFRIDVRRAPMCHLVAIHDVRQGRWLLRILSHHLLDDNTTMKRLVEEIALIQQGRETELLEPMPFRRFVAHARLSRDRADHETFFRKLLGDVDEPTMPFGVLNARGDGSDIEQAAVPVESDLDRALRKQARRYGVSAAALFHLAWGLVLSKVTDRDDVVFGTVLSGRMHGSEEAERMLGVLINTLPIRLQLGARSIEQCLIQTHNVLSELLHHEHTSLVLAQRCSALPKRTPLFSALLNYRHGAQQSKEIAAWEGVSHLGSEERTNYPITLMVNDGGSEFQLIVQVPLSVGAQRVVNYMHAALAELISALVNRPEANVRELEIVSAEERSLLQRWGMNQCRYPDFRPVHSVFERQVQAAAPATALVVGDERISYGELNARANRLAWRLIGLGVGPEVLVGIALERSIEMVVGLLAILKAGAAYVPLDPEHPAERLIYMMRDSGTGLLITQSSTAALLPASDGIGFLRLDELDLSTEPEHNPDVLVGPENLAYVIYTSGSTGQPKGAQLSHRNAARLLAATHEWFHFTDRDVWTQFHSYAFDFSVWEIFGALCYGGRLVIVPYKVSRSPSDFLALLRREQVTVLNQTPSAFKQLMQAPALYDRDVPALKLRIVIFGGEALDPRDLRPWFEHFGNLNPRLINMYGITETTVHVTYRPILKNDLDSPHSPIGERIPDLGLRVLDSGLNLVPAGVPGDLYVAGDGLARGYLNRAGLSSERFIADPFSEHGERMYRTGDQVRWSGEGQLEYLGRVDHQVKIRGFRIELKEIEAQLSRHVRVREAVVLAREDVSGDKRLTAYVTVVGEVAPSVEEMRSHLKSVLPEYMVPADYAVLESFPLTANGKLDRNALPVPQASALRVQNYEAPQGSIEETLAAIWAEALGVERIGRHDSFFELGGHSLSALQVVAQTGQHFSVQLPLTLLFERPSLREYSSALDAELQAAISQEDIELGRMSKLFEALED